MNAIGAFFGNQEKNAVRVAFEEAVRLEPVFLQLKKDGFPESESISLDAIYGRWMAGASSALYEASNKTDPYFKALGDAYGVANAHLNEIRLHWPLAGRGPGFWDELPGEIEKQKTIAIDFTKMLVLGAGLLAVVLYFSKR